MEIIEKLGYLTTFWAIGTILIPFILKIFSKKYSDNILGNIAVSLGVLGTFFGIFLGLLDFDTNDITGSIPKLLNGLKTAFITSIAGMVVSLIFKLFSKVELDVKVEEDNFSMQDFLEKIEKAIIGDGEASLSTQLLKIRTTNQDGFKDLNVSFKNFADKMVENNTTSLIEALTKVMEDFNTQINAQFGENFKHLNEGVGKMLDWQKEYTYKVEQMTAQFERTLNGIKKCEDSLQNITEKSNIYHESAKKLDDLLNNLHQNLSTFDQLSTKVTNAFPIIEKQIYDLTHNFSTAVHEASKNIKNNSEEQYKTMQDVSKNIKDLMERNVAVIEKQIQTLDEALADELQKSLNSLGSQLASLSKRFVDDYEPLTRELQKVVQIARKIQYAETI